MRGLERAFGRPTKTGRNATHGPLWRWLLPQVGRHADLVKAAVPVKDGLVLETACRGESWVTGAAVVLCSGWDCTGAWPGHGRHRAEDELRSIPLTPALDPLVLDCEHLDRNARQRGDRMTSVDVARLDGRRRWAVVRGVLEGDDGSGLVLILVLVLTGDGLWSCRSKLVRARGGRSRRERGRG